MAEFLDLPFVTMDGTVAGCTANRFSFDPFVPLGAGGILPYGYEPLSGDSFVIPLVGRSWQPLGVSPSGSEGRITLFVDRCQLYDKETGFTTGVEDGHPRGTQPLSVIGWQAGSRPAFIAVEVPFGGPVTFRKGDRLCVAPETNGYNVGAGGIQADFAVAVEGWAGVNLAAGVIHAMPLNGSAGSGLAPSCRAVFPVKTGGSRVKVRLTAPAAGLTISHVGVGIRTGSAADMAATPVAGLFSGSAGAVLGANVSLESDDITLTVPDNSALVVDVHVPNTSPWGFKTQAGPASGVNTWYSMTASYNTASQPSPTLQAGRVHCVDYVKVWTP